MKEEFKVVGFSRQEVIDKIRNKAYFVESSADLDELVEKIGNARYVLLGEASHNSCSSGFEKQLGIPLT